MRQQEQLKAKMAVAMTAFTKVLEKKKEGQLFGVITCPACHGNLHYWFVGPKKHARAKCDTAGCIELLE